MEGTDQEEGTYMYPPGTPAPKVPQQVSRHMEL